MKIKLSDLHVGNILRITVNIYNSLPYYVYVVLTDLLRYDNADNNTFQHYTITGRRLFSDNKKRSKFDLNGIKKEDILKNQYTCKCNIAFLSKNDLCLLINEPHKTIWFDRVLNDEIKNIGMNYYNIMLETVKPSGSP